MITENIYAAKTHLSRLIERALDGEEVIIAKAGKPVVRLVPYKEKVKPIQFGTLKGQVSISDDFNDYSAEVAEMFSEYEPKER
jgi:prevent-host-death family protein